MTTTNKIAVLLAAAGSSTRMGLGCKKEFLPLNSGTVISSAAKAFLTSIKCNTMAVLIPSGSSEETAKKALFSDLSIPLLLEKNNTNLIFVKGGKTRQASVYNGLIALKPFSPKIVLIHDGARPFITQEIIQDTLSAAIEYGASVPGIPPVDTQKIITEKRFIQTHLDRSKMVAVQTPQGFYFNKLLSAHQKASLDKKQYTDDTEIWEKYCGHVKVVTGNSSNKKITYKEDYNKENSMISIKTGLGYDIHKLIENRKLIIGGIEIPSQKGELGHSDADALLHAITDALLGASCLGDIGSFFPPEEEKWKDANSAELLKSVWQKIKEKGYKIGNIDCVIKLEKPKFLPYRNQVRESIANILQIDLDQIFVKAKTGEQMDSVGHENAIEAWATCILYKA